MRFDNVASFFKDSSEYDPVTSQYVGSTTPVATIRCNITDLGLTRSAELFGDVQHSAMTVRLLADPPSKGKWDYFTVDDDRWSGKYVSVTKRGYRNARTLISGEYHGSD